MVSEDLVDVQSAVNDVEAEAQAKLIEVAKEHLRLLSIFHYILGGLCVFFALFPLIYLGLGVAMFTGAMPMESSSNQQPPPEWLGIVFAIMGGVFFLLGQTLAWLIIYCGRQIKQRQKHTLIFVIACLQCMWFPLGTALGVFTIIVLNKREVKTMFGKA